MLIVEGADLVGKTTICKRFEKVLGLTYQHLSRLPDQHDRLWDYVAMMNRRTVRDRFHLSEIVYSQVRGESHCQLTPEKLRLVEAYLALHGAYVVVITATKDVIERRATAERRLTEMYPLDKVLRANDLFVGMCTVRRTDYHIRVTHVDDDLSEHVSNVYNAYVSRQEQLTYELSRRAPWTVPS